MRRLGGCFDAIVSPGNLWRAWCEFRSGKRSRSSVRAWEWDADRQILALHRELTAGAYQPGGFRLVVLREPKRRLIAAAPVRDRVVHHAVHRVLAPRLDRRFLDSSYACIAGRGSHCAVLALVAALRRFPWVLSLDIRHYFLSIDRRILLELMARRLKEQPLLALLHRIAESGDGLYHLPGVAGFLGLEPGFPPAGCGLPIGNLTSQWWGNHYLDGLDHFVKRRLKVPHYQRYMDDLTLLAGSREQLVEARDALAEWLAHERRLRLKKPLAPPRSTRQAFEYLGYRVSPAGVRPTRQALRRMQVKVAAAVLRGKAEAIERSIASYRGVLELGACGLQPMTDPAGGRSTD